MLDVPTLVKLAALIVTWTLALVGVWLRLVKHINGVGARATALKGRLDTFDGRFDEYKAATTAAIERLDAELRAQERAAATRELHAEKRFTRAETRLDIRDVQESD